MLALWMYFWDWPLPPPPPPQGPPSGFLGMRTMDEIIDALDRRSEGYRLPRGE